MSEGKKDVVEMPDILLHLPYKIGIHIQGFPSAKHSQKAKNWMKYYPKYLDTMTDVSQFMTECIVKSLGSPVDSVHSVEAFI